MNKGELRSAENAALICSRISEGYSLRQIASELGCDNSAISHWVVDDPEFAQRYARAREAQAEHMASELLEIADDGSNDWMEREGHTVLNGEHVQRSRVRVDTRKWLMAKMAPKRYGDKTTTEVVGKDGEPLIPPEPDRTKVALGILTELREVWAARDKGEKP